jgi:chemotaxis protein histidine kinase CheA
MAIIKVENKTYTVDPLYQWDKNQALEIRGLSLARVPEIHFTTKAMDRAIPRQASMDAAGIITVNVPNSLLQKPYTLQVFICTYEGATFKTLYKLEVPVKARPKPADYTLEDDPEVYSFNALENRFVNTVVELQADYDAFTKKSAADLQAAKEELKTSAANAAEAATKAAAASAASASNAATSAASSAATASNAATSAASAAASAAAKAVEAAILKGAVSEIVKVDALPAEPAADVLYFIV